MRDHLAGGEAAVPLRPQRLEDPRGLERVLAALERGDDDEGRDADPDQQVADREHIRERELMRQGEDVAQESEPVRGRIDVGAGQVVEPRRVGGAHGDGHPAAVGGDRGGVQHHSDHHRRERADPEVGHGEGDQEGVARQMGRPEVRLRDI